MSRLVQSLDDANLRYGASLALVRLGDQAVPALRKSLASTSLDQRVWSAFTLGEIGPAAAASAKDLTALLESSDAALRAAAAEALGKLGAASPASVGALAVRLSDDDIDVRQHAAVALGQIGPPAHRSAAQLVQSLSDSRTRRVAREALIRIGPSASPAVVAALSKDELRFDAVMVLRQADPAAARQAGVDRPGVDDLASLRLALRDQSRAESERTQAAMALASLGDAGIAVLIEAFETPALVPTAVDAFSTVGPAGVKPLVKTFKHEQPTVRAAAADALSQIGPAASSAVDDLVRLFDDEDHDVRYAGVRALDALGEQAASAVPDLVAVILDPSQREPARQWAIMAIVNTAKVRHEEVVAALIKASQDASNFGVRSLASQQVRKLDPEAAKAAGVR